MICRCITVEKLFWQHSQSISGNACFSNLQGTIHQKSNFPQTCCFLLLSSISTVLTSPEKIATDFQHLLYTVCRASATSWTLVVGWHLLFKQRAGQGKLNSGEPCTKNPKPKKQKVKKKWKKKREREGKGKIRICRCTHMKGPYTYVGPVWTSILKYLLC